MSLGRIPQLSCLKCAFNLLYKDVVCQPLGDKRVVFRMLSCLRPISAYGTSGLRRPFSSEANVLPTTLNTSPVIVDFGVSCCQGKLKENEDHYDSATLQRGLSYFAVFDGHRGKLSSDFLRQQLGIILSKTFVKEEHLAKNGHKLMQNAFDICEEILETEIQSSNLDQMTKDHNGSTALAAVISNNAELVLAQTGDSRAVLCRSGEAICLTDDHTPNNEDEVNRIEKSGGWIDWDTKLVPYVNGILAMTRSFGNCYLKQSGITHTPFVNYINLDKANDQFLVLCTDGVSDWMTDDEIVSIVSQFDDPNESAHELTCCARQYGSTDDATAVVVPLGAWSSKTVSTRKDTVNFLRSNTLKRD